MCMGLEIWTVDTSGTVKDPVFYIKWKWAKPVSDKFIEKVAVGNASPVLH